MCERITDLEASLETAVLALSSQTTTRPALAVMDGNQPKPRPGLQTLAVKQSYKRQLRENGEVHKRQIAAKQLEVEFAQTEARQLRCKLDRMRAY